MTQFADLVPFIDQWNASHGEQFFLSKDLLIATFFSWPADLRTVLFTDGGVALLKKDRDLTRIHWIFGANAGFNQRIFAQIIDQSSKWNSRKTVFGGGLDHIFPGVPLIDGISGWLKIFPPHGPAQSDFQGDLFALSSNAATLRGTLRSPDSINEKERLAAFVHSEFPGRWSQEFERDFRAGNSEHYFGYFQGTGLTGYVRLYGWKPDYWAPGVYWRSPGEKTGGLGPIGVAKLQRGKGLGQEILAASWKMLYAKGLRSVRVDWTTEIDFYTRAGLREVARYQPAQKTLGEENE